jgi:hypothetical protein
LPVEFTYFIVGVFAGLVTFATTKLNIRFAYYFYVLSKNSEQLMASRDPNSPDYKAYRKHLQLMYLNILAPVIVVSFYLAPLFEQLLVPEICSQSFWNMIRVGVVILIIGIRVLVYREEI